MTTRREHEVPLAVARVQPGTPTDADEVVKVLSEVKQELATALRANDVLRRLNASLHADVARRDAEIERLRAGILESRR
jgi:hypothetical protein